MKRGRCYLGTSGWSYPHWAKGRFYPKGLKPGEWLAFLSKEFNTVEVNSSCCHNNGVDGHAIGNARQLIDAVGA